MNSFLHKDIRAESSVKSAFEHVQNGWIRITLHMCKLTSWHLLSTEILSSIQLFCLWAGEGPDQTVQADLGLCCPHMPEDKFWHVATHTM